MKLVLVVDASVAVKWFLRERAAEADVGLALALLAAVAEAQVELVQPPHFVAEVMAVLAREAPANVAQDLRDLLAISFARRDDAAVYARAVRLALDLDLHLFDTLYHAVALETSGATFITADKRYLAKVRGMKSVCALADAGALLAATSRGAARAFTQ